MTAPTIFITRRIKILLIITIIFSLTTLFHLSIDANADSTNIPNIKVSEIMYNPLGDDTKYEFIEIFMGENINGTNLSTIYIEGISFSFPNTIWNSPTPTYLPIARSKEGFEERYNFSPYSTFREALTNSGGTLTIIMKTPVNNTITPIILDQILYTDTSKEGFSLVRQGNSFIQGRIQGGTPGIADNISENYSGNGSENGDNTGEGNSSSNCYTYKITFKVNKETNNKEKLAFTPEISPKLRDEDRLTYWIEDIEKKILKEKVSTSTIGEKSFTPNIQSEIALLKIIGEIESECTPANISRGEEIFIVYNKDKALTITPKKNQKSGDDLSLEVSAFGTSNITLEIEHIFHTSISKPKGLLKQEIIIPNKIICAISREDTMENEGVTSSAKTINIKLEGEGITSSQNISISNLCKSSKLSKIYTLAKKIYEGRNITLFVSFDLDLSKDKYYISLFNEDQAQVKSTIGESSPLKFNIVLNEGKNKLRAELRKDNNIIEGIETEIEAESLQTLEIDSNKLTQKGESQETSVSFKTSQDIHETNQNKSKTGSAISKTYYVFLGLSLIGNIILMWRN